MRNRGLSWHRVCRRGIVPSVVVLLLCAACTCGEQHEYVDTLNDMAYYYHYISLDSTIVYADEAYANSGAYEAGAMEALNNIAFVELATMDYAAAEEDLRRIITTTDNQLEQFVANVQMMRLCQRTSRNHDFYRYYWAAESNAERLQESSRELSPRAQQRLVYADTEMKIVYAAYLYYIGQMDNFRAALAAIDVGEELERDTAQLLNYLYNIGSGGFYTDGSADEVSQWEFEALVRCYLLARRTGQDYWQANALQAISEHLLDRSQAPRLIAENALYLRAINDDEAPDSLLAGNFAQRAVNLFIDYGDTYQTAGALRTLSDCYFQIGLVDDAIASLNIALLRDTLINQAPALTASLYERLTINYSALDNKPFSDYYRNLYLDAQEDTRQDRELDVRAEQLSKVSQQLNYILLILLLVIVVLCATLFILIQRRRKKDNRATVKALLMPLEQWKEQMTLLVADNARRSEDIAEEQTMAALTLEHNMQVNIEQRAKVALVNSITPFINSIIAEIEKLKTREESDAEQAKRYAYIAELTNTINAYNDVLTRWIQLRKGEVNLKIKSFALQDLFAILAKSKATFAMQHIHLTVQETAAVVKADKALTLFMLNTLADNARKAIPAEQEEGAVDISAVEQADYVEIAITDNGRGMDDEECAHLFTRQSVDKKQQGFGLVNCRGIIERYKKVSQIFSVCQLTAESKQGKGSTFRFRLPRGVARVVVFLAGCFLSLTASAAAESDALTASKAYADSAYFCNLQGRYDDAISFAQQTYMCLNEYYKQLYPDGKDTLLFAETDVMTDLLWLRDSVAIDFGVLLDIRNETAVAALAQHNWEVYSYNNTIYTRLFRELSADNDLPRYVHNMQVVSSAKNIAIALLVLVLLGIIVAYYFLYYRQKVVYKSLLEQIKRINEALLEDIDDGEKLAKIRSLWRDDARRTSSLAREYAAAGGLNAVVEEIIATLEKSKSYKLRDAADKEFATDELRRVRYESDCLHVSNNVLDNCLSALKHETMYYPSRLQQIVDRPERNIDYLEEVAQYYRLLFSLLSEQAQAQVKDNVKVDEPLKAYLKGLLFTLFDDCSPAVARKELDDGYEAFTFLYPNLSLSKEQVAALFMPLTPNLKCLLVRQVVREIGDSYNSRGCGVRATLSGDGSSVSVVVTLTKAVGFDIAR